jgi:hypothetical protein
MDNDLSWSVHQARTGTEQGALQTHETKYFEFGYFDQHAHECTCTHTRKCTKKTTTVWGEGGTTMVIKSILIGSMH